MLFKYEAVIAKCKCLYGKLLTAKDFENLLKCTSISDIASYLQGQTSYAEFFGELSTLKTINRSKLEYYTRKSLISDFVKIYRFIFGNEHHFVNLLLAKYELEFILKIWRHCVWLNTENNSINSNEYLTDIGILEIQMIYMIYQYNSKIDIESLQNISTVEQFMNAVKETDYFHIFAKHLNEDISKNYTELETAIYSEYYKILYESAKVFDGDTQKTVQALIGIDVDLINLNRIARLLFNFRSTNSDSGNYDVFKYLVPIRYKLTDDHIQRMISLTDRDSFFKYCEENLYYAKKQSFKSYTAIEQYRWDFLYKFYKSNAVRTRSGFDVIIKYFFIKEIEIKNLFCLIEGIRYRMSPERIKRYLIGFDYSVQEERGTV